MVIHGAIVGSWAVGPIASQERSAELGRTRREYDDLCNSPL